MIRWFVLTVMLGLTASQARAQLVFDITPGTQQRTPVAIAPFAGEAALGGNLTGIVRADLERSGLLRLIDAPAVLRQNVAIARGFTPMTPEDMQLLRQRCAPFAADGHLELFKSTKRYDGAVGRQQHGYPPPAEMPL